MRVRSNSCHDVFICHASEDKEGVVLPIVTTLRAYGVSTWIDCEQLRIGDRLQPSIDVALACCRFAAVVFSPIFFDKPWIAYELDRIMYSVINDRQVLLPIVHRMTGSELLERAPFMEGKIWRSTADFSIEQLAKEIAHVVRV